MTTNGLTLVRQAAALREAGLKRVNVSLDSLVPERFAEITGVDGLDRVLNGIVAARKAGLWPVRINAVVVRGHNDQELPDLLRYAAAEGLEIRFIELMPMGPLHASWDQRYVQESEMRRTLAPAVESWQTVAIGSDSARRYVATLTDGTLAKVGFITAMSHPFCDTCDRIRIGSHGEFFPCLMDKPSGNLMPAIRPIFDGNELDERLAAGLGRKAPEHPVRGHAVMIELGG
jgi:cyclic pyranopterin phosphate synthase